MDFETGADSRRKTSASRAAMAVLMTAVVSLALLALGAPADATPSNDPLVVNSTRDDSDADTGDYRCQTSRGECTLRAAIEQANASHGPDRIEFAIPGSGVVTFRPGSLLPDLWGGATTIDGYTQSGAQPNTAASGTNAVIKIEIDAGGLERGLRLASAANTVRGLSVYDSSVGIELFGEAADGNLVAGNFLGTSASGRTTSATTSAIAVNQGPDRNRLGTPDLADRNLLAGYRRHGIRINHGESSQNVIQNNLIGSTPNLDGPLGGYVGVDVQWWAWGNLVGGFGPREGNHVVANYSRGGIDLSHGATGNSIIGNMVGTLGDGNSISSWSGNLSGILLKDGPLNNYIGFNTVGGSEKYGIQSYSHYNSLNVFESNRIGVGVNGGDIGNSGRGVLQAGFDELYYNNIVANNGGEGILVSNTNNGQQHFYTPNTTRRTQLRQNTYYNNDLLPLDLSPSGANGNDPGDGDDGPNGLLNSPVIDGIGPGKVFGATCAGCIVEVYSSGTIQGDGTLSIDDPAAGTGQGWVGTAQADGNGRFGLADGRMVAGKRIWVLAIDQEGNTSELSGPTTVPAGHQGVDGTAPPSIGGIAQPTRPSPPPTFSSPNGIISGTVTMSSGPGVADVAVQQFTVDADGSRGQWVRTIPTNSQGGYAFHLPPGCWSLTFVAPAGEVFTSQSPWLTTQACVEVGQETTDVNAVIIDQSQAATLSGAVVSDGAGVGAVKVDLFTSTEAGGRDGFAGFTTTDGSGQFSFDVTPGCWVLTFIAPDGRTFTNGSRFLNQARCVTAGANSSGPDAELQSANAATLTGQIVDGSGPVSGVKSNLFNAGADGQRSTFIGPATTGGDGFYSYQQSTGCYIEVLIAPEGRTFQSTGSRFIERGVCLTAPDTTTQPVATLN